jgi:hypothetical protein
MKPFRFGVNVWRAGSRAEWADKARKLENLGYRLLTLAAKEAEWWRRSFLSTFVPTRRVFVGYHLPTRWGGAGPFRVEGRRRR